MTRYEDYCVNCDGALYPCSNCGKQHTAVMYCDQCGKDLSLDDVYTINDEDLCSDCFLDSIELVRCCKCGGTNFDLYDVDGEIYCEDCLKDKYRVKFSPL